MLEGFYFAAFCAFFFTWSHSARFHLWIRLNMRYMNMKDSENQHNKALLRRKHNLQNPLNNTVQQDAKI
jgi:hypothetical protein